VSRLVVTLEAPTTDESFAALGANVRLIATGIGARAAVAEAREAVLDYHARLSRFLPASELSALNDAPGRVVAASPLLRSAVRAALWAAERSRGLVDPCLLDALEAVGYAHSYEPGGAVLPPSGRWRRARPHPGRRWRQVRVDEAAGTVARPPGLRLDLGGSGKGHLADSIASRLEPFGQWVVDCGGDIRIGGRREVEVAHPLRDEPAARLLVEDHAVATSSVVSRAWTTAGGRPAHHLLDPLTGRPVRTGLLTATALAPTTLEAETLAKMALLRGPDEARDVLAARGGVLVHEGGRVESIGGRFEVAA
jgi:FAD:protein FMN transferase